MEETLKNIEVEKRNRIINSALEEFSKNTFDKASTNSIVKNAGISKGLLYHYFKTKQSLYDYLIVFVFHGMAEEIINKINWEESDLFERIKKIILVKMDMMSKYPYILDFSKKIFTGKSVNDIKQNVEEYLPDIYSKVYQHNIDFSLFKDDVDMNRAIKITQWTMEKISEEYIARVETINNENFKDIIEEIDVYLVMLRKAFYK